MTVSPRIAAVSSFSTAGLLFGAALMPAGSAFATASCPTGSTLVDGNVCEVTFTETPDSAWTPPAGITKLQALIVGGGGYGGPAAGDAYAGGGGDVRLIELSTTGDVDITVGAGGDSVAGDGGDTEIVQGSLDEIAQGGQVGAPGGADVGGASGNGNAGDTYNLGGGGAGGVAEGNNGGAGVIVNEIDPATFTLFAEDDRCLGGGGAGAWAWGSASLNAVEAGCGGGYPAAPDTATFDGNNWTWSGSMSDVELIEPVVNSGGGAGALDRGTLEYTDGADGIVVLRFTASELAATGFDVTGSIAAGAALVASGVAAVVTRRRRSA